jgi:hypothetical protein
MSQKAAFFFTFTVTFTFSPAFATELQFTSDLQLDFEPRCDPWPHFDLSSLACTTWRQDLVSDKRSIRGPQVLADI